LSGFLSNGLSAHGNCSADLVQHTPLASLTRCKGEYLAAVGGTVTYSLTSMARGVLRLAISIGVLASCPAGAEILLRADRVELTVPNGGMTRSRTPRSVSKFKHRLLDLTITVEVDGPKYYEHWKRACAPEKLDWETAASYQTGTLARTDQYFYSRISQSSRYGIFTPRGSWLQHCLIFRSDELAAKVTIDLPKSAQGNEATASEIEKLLASVRLAAASIEERGESDPRLVLEMPDDVVPTGLPTYAFQLKHNRLPLSFNVTLSDPKAFETAKLLNQVSARGWKVGSLARTDEYFYYFVGPDRYPDDFALGFRAEGITAEIDVTVGRSSLDTGDITVEEIERILSSARVISASELVKGRQNPSPSAR